MKNWKKLISAGLALGLVLTSVPQSTSVVYAQENGTLQNVTFEQEQEAVQNAPITVQKVNGLSKDFVNGVDVSSYLSLVESGAKYYDEKGDETDLFDLLENAGVNYVRLRVWNDPFPWDEDGNYKYVGADGTTEYKAAAVTQAGISVNGVQQYCLVDDPDTQVYREVYGAGVCDVATAAIIGKKATDHHMKVLIDFHYSDFWADPKKQRVPKQWEGMSLEEKTSALSEFTEESLNTLLDAGVDVGMVQVGNEINNGMAGETDEANVYQLLKAGSAAVRKVSQEKKHEILVALHFTDPQSEDYQYKRAEGLEAAGVDYDVFATSFYPFWHGSATTLKENLQRIADKFNKKVMVAEISYAWTMEDGDSYGNVVYSGAGDQNYDYTIDVEGQATAIRDAIAAISAIGENGLGTFYWEPAWIPVNNYADATDKDGTAAKNELAWKLNGSGWGTVYSKDYDPEIAENERGGGTWDNQAFFDFNGKVLPSLNVYKWVYTGAVGSTKVKRVAKTSVVMNYMETPQLPETVTVTLNDDSTMEAPVTWKQEEVDALKTATYGDYQVSGSVDAFTYTDKLSGKTVLVPAGTWTTSCNVTIEGKSYITNGDFETGDAQGWNLINYLGEDVGYPKVDKNSSNAQKGIYYYTGWSKESMEITKEQIPDGVYALSAYYQGTGIAEVSKDAALYAVITYKDGTTKTCSTGIEIHNVWKDFYQATVNVELDANVVSVKVGTRIACTANELGAWVVCDNITLIKSGELAKKDDSSNGGTSGGNAETTIVPTDKKDDSQKKDNTDITDNTGKTENTVKKGTTISNSKAAYIVTNTEKKTVVYKAGKTKEKTVIIPATVKIDGVTYKVTSIDAKAFANNKTVTTVVIGSNITSIEKGAFSGAKKLKTITLKSGKLTKKSVKNCLKGSAVTTIQLKGNAKKQYAKYVKYFTKTNCGKKVVIKK